MYNIRPQGTSFEGKISFHIKCEFGNDVCGYNKCACDKELAEFLMFKVFSTHSGIYKHNEDFQSNKNGSGFDYVNMCRKRVLS